MLIQEKINAPDTLLKMSNSVTTSVRRVSGRGKHRDRSYGQFVVSSFRYLGTLYSAR